MNTDLPMSRVTDVSTAAKYSGGLLPKLGYVVWIVYGPLAESNRWLSAGLIGTVFMVAVVAAQYRQREIKLMDCTSLGYFVVETMTVLMGHPVNRASSPRSGLGRLCGRRVAHADQWVSLYTAIHAQASAS
jgi:hypothetical protein